MMIRMIVISQVFCWLPKLLTHRSIWYDMIWDDMILNSSCVVSSALVLSERPLRAAPCQCLLVPPHSPRLPLRSCSTPPLRRRDAHKYLYCWIPTRRGLFYLPATCMIVLYDCMTNTTWSWWSSLPLHISRVKMSPFGCHLTNTYLPPYIQNVSFYRCTCVCKGKLTFFSFFNIFFCTFPLSPQKILSQPFDPFDNFTNQRI